MYDRLKVREVKRSVSTLEAALAQANAKREAAERAAKQLAAAEAKAAAAHEMIETLNQRIADLHFVIARARINSTVEGAAKEAKGPSRGQD
jgi:predicted  nucleic acid-binding Zn-ribbon protein